MAYVSDFTCSLCGEEKREVYDYSHPGVCIDCTIRKKKIEKQCYLEFQQELPLETRVRKIEEELYDLRIADRLKSLELRFATY